MVKYVLAALALKAFSLNDATKKAYRSIGNVVGQRARQNPASISMSSAGIYSWLCARSMAPSRRKPGPSSWAPDGCIGIRCTCVCSSIFRSPCSTSRFYGRAWKRLFENDVQYFNRLQACDWIDRTGSARFVLPEPIAETADVSGLPIAPVFRDYRQEDLACTILTLVHQKRH